MYALTRREGGHFERMILIHVCMQVRMGVRVWPLLMEMQLLRPRLVNSRSPFPVRFFSRKI